MTRNALGRGLGALIREPEPQVPVEPPPVQNFAVTSGGAAVAPARDGAPTGGPLQIDIDLIDPSPFQPRTRFREEGLDELARSIKASGIIQPLVVRSVVGNRYQLIAGERRWRASQRAGLDKVSVIVRDVPDELALEMTLVENIQREDLNAMEAATGVRAADGRIPDDPGAGCGTYGQRSRHGGERDSLAETGADHSGLDRRGKADGRAWPRIAGGSGSEDADALRSTRGTRRVNRAPDRATCFAAIAGNRCAGGISYGREHPRCARRIAAASGDASACSGRRLGCDQGSSSSNIMMTRS